MSYHDGNRVEWHFPYAADVLHKAAQDKHAFHAGRLDWWSKKRDEIEVTIKSEGIVIDTSVAEDVGKLSGYSNRGRQASVTIENSLVKDFNECVDKQAEHREKIKEYDAWVQVLASQGKSSFNLNQTDWLFFFGR